MEKTWEVRCPCCGIIHILSEGHPLYGKDTDQLEFIHLLHPEVNDEEEEDDGSSRPAS